MCNHVHIAEATEIDIYFCDPHSPWQRGTSENTNGLLRQYFPKGTDLSGYHRDYLDFIAAELNRRPRKRLGWRTPAEALDQLLSKPQDPPQCCIDRLNPPRQASSDVRHSRCLPRCEDFPSLVKRRTTLPLSPAL